MNDLLKTVDRCLCYTTDINYALPTLLSAIQARANLSMRTDIIILLVGSSSIDADHLADICKSEDVIFKSIPRHAIDNLTIDYARYFLHDLIDIKYKFVTHIDGDTQILGSLDPLLDFEVTPGRVLAVPDPIALIVRAYGRYQHRQLKRLVSIGLTPELSRSYVNTGLFQARRDDIANISKECRDLALREGPRMIFGQQDAFNIALGPTIDLASFRWNYPAFFSNFDFQSLVKPRVRHFMSNPRPWQGPFPPWKSAGYTPYVDLVRRHPELTRLSSPLQGKERIRYEFQQRVKRIFEPIIWNRSYIRQHISCLESASLV